MHLILRTTVPNTQASGFPIAYELQCLYKIEMIRERHYN